MIIRRRRNRNFTVVTNCPIEDDRLSYDALGLLTYLLSRPDDWTVKQDQLRRRGGIGKDKLRRIMDDLMAAGYIVVQAQRGADGKPVKGEGGQFAANEYVVYDEPQQPDEGTTSGAAVAENPPRSETPDGGGKSATDRGGSAAAENPPRPIYKDLPKTDSNKPEGDLFEQFWAAYPRRENRRQALVEFNHAVASVKDPAVIVGGARAYAVSVSKQGRETKYIKMPANWLADRLWEDQPKAADYARPGTELRTITSNDTIWHAFLAEYEKAKGGKCYARKSGSWSVPADYQPGAGTWVLTSTGGLRWQRTETSEAAA